MAAQSSQPANGDAETELQAGIKAHKKGDLQAAEACYNRALVAFGLPSSVKIADVPPSASAQLAELLHLLGALRVQKLVGSQEKGNDDGSDSENDEASKLEDSHAVKELASAVDMLRAAIASLPTDETPACRARVLSSLGVGLLHWPSENQKGPCKASGSSLAEAVGCLREATKLDGGRWSAWFNLSRALAKLKDEKEKSSSEDEASTIALERINALRRARDLRPKHAGVLYRLGMSVRAKEDIPEAVDALESFLIAIEDEPKATQEKYRTKRAGAKHWLAILRGETSDTAPPEYVAGLFDSYAEKFDDHLVHKLDYRTPELLADELRKIKDVIVEESSADAGIAASSLFKRCADLGCGTGLMGPPLRELGTEWLEGIDLSSKMLKKADEKERGYDKLICGDLLDIFKNKDNGEPPTFDLVVAADVFVYIGDLLPSLTETARCLARPHGVVAFSTEAPPRSGSANENEADVPEGEFKLAETGRYMHSASYVQATAEGCGLRLSTRVNVVLRKNAGKPVHGHLHIFRPAL